MWGCSHPLSDSYPFITQHMSLSQAKTILTLLVSLRNVDDIQHGLFPHPLYCGTVAINFYDVYQTVWLVTWILESSKLYILIIEIFILYIIYIYIFWWFQCGNSYQSICVTWQITQSQEQKKHKNVSHFFSF